MTEKDCQLLMEEISRVYLLRFFLEASEEGDESSRSTREDKGKKKSGKGKGEGEKLKLICAGCNARKAEKWLPCEHFKYCKKCEKDIENNKKKCLVCKEKFELWLKLTSEKNASKES